MSEIFNLTTVFKLVADRSDNRLLATGADRDFKVFLLAQNFKVSTFYSKEPYLLQENIGYLPTVPLLRLLTGTRIAELSSFNDSL